MRSEEPRPVLSICVPVYDERENLPLLHAAIVKVVEPIGLATEIILVDDASKDGSWAEIEKLAAADPRVRGVKFAYNCGETAASDAGMRAARGQYVMTMDADLQNDPQDIPAFMEALGQGWDCVRVRQPRGRAAVLMELGPVIAPLLAWVIRRHVERLIGALDQLQARWADPSRVSIDGYWVLVRDLEVLQTLLDDIAVLVANPELPADILRAIDERGIDRARFTPKAVLSEDTGE